MHGVLSRVASAWQQPEWTIVSAVPFKEVRGPPTLTRALTLTRARARARTLTRARARTLNPEPGPQPQPQPRPEP